ncbi:MAG: hypothetical protein J0M33_13690 [Anaerolineae bacterium]|nr:hypothetical protein [Anaerolineae bacterium]
MSGAIFLCDYEKFREESQAFMEEADRGEYISIVQRAIQIANSIHPEKWILNDLGTTLNGFSESEIAKFSQSHATGFSFLVLLSQYLTLPPIPSPRFNNIHKVINLLKWDNRDITLLMKGATTTALLKPDLVSDLLERPPADSSNWNDPAYYWWWLRPEFAFYTGWWSIDQLRQLRHKLIDSKMHLDYAVTVILDADPSLTNEEIIDDFNYVIQFFDMAINKGVGLLYIVA